MKGLSEEIWNLFWAESIPVTQYPFSGEGEAVWALHVRPCLLHLVASLEFILENAFLFPPALDPLRDPVVHNRKIVPGSTITSNNFSAMVMGGYFNLYVCTISRLIPSNAKGDSNLGFFQKAHTLV